jgi:hypothetical protein
MANRKFTVTVNVAIDAGTLTQDCLQDVEEMVIDALKDFEDGEEVKVFEDAYNAEAEEIK